MNDEQFERYSRHMLLPEIGIAGQEKLLQSRVLIIGMGGLGCPVLMYLAAAGVGHLVINDFDHVDLSNLQRQIAHGVADVGDDKVASAKRTVARLNPGVTVSSLGWALDDDELLEQVALADVVVDASDNFETRFANNRACVRTATPLVSGAAIRFDGQVAVFDPRCEQSPCYRCLYTESRSDGDSCSQIGVFSPLLGIIGSMQAAETIKLITEIQPSLAGRLIVLDALGMDIRTLKLKRNPRCPDCSQRAPVALFAGSSSAN